MSEATAPRFWMVWNPRGRNPTARHCSRAVADREAKRLAAANPSDQFFVLKAVGGAVCPVVEPTEIKLTSPYADDVIPF